ncbi:MAG: hypothetical protein M2R45_03360 [Verrucomicrobia subdivision 3 bacterium]|nr:hypothetical protein [Limisphaerales bacterium]MCS1416727.1 hypothetical protein [Limisphaerales bacterium]
MLWSDGIIVPTECIRRLQAVIFHCLQLFTQAGIGEPLSPRSESWNKREHFGDHATQGNPFLCSFSEGGRRLGWGILVPPRFMLLRRCCGYDVDVTRGIVV